MPRKPPPRLRASEYAGPRRYSLTVCTFQRQRLLSEPATTECCLAHLRTCAAQYAFAVIAYCFMPDHVHLLVAGEAEYSDLQEFVRVWKQRTAFYERRERGRGLWQRGFYEHVLRREEATLEVARYILANPVRAGLVSYPSQYPWLGSFETSVSALLEALQDVGRGPT